MVPPPGVRAERGVRRGSHLFKVFGHSYYFNKKMKGNRSSFECVFRKKNECRGRGTAADGGVGFRLTQAHNHPDDRHYFRKQQFRNGVLERCRDGDFAPFRLIYNDERRKLRPEVQRQVCADIPFVALRPSMVRARQVLLPNLPKTLPELADMLEAERHAHIGVTLDNEDHIFFGSGGSRENGTAFVILASNRMAGELEKSKIILSDATFCTPAGLECRQIWNIVTMKQGHHIIPCMRVLMQTKSQAAYEAVIDKIMELCPDFDPDEIMCDFEEAQSNAWHAKRPRATIHGCLFHSAKAISGKAKKLGLTRLIKNNHNAHSIVRSMCALALLPSKDIPVALGKLSRRALREGLWRRLKLLFTYFKRYWLPRAHLLSVYNLNDRTNNACESDNRSLRRAIKFKHPSLFCFLNGVLEMEDDTMQDVAVIRLNRAASRARRASVLNNDARIKSLTAQLASRQISTIDFLRKVSRRIQRAFNRGLGVDDNFA